MMQVPDTVLKYIMSAERHYEAAHKDAQRARIELERFNASAPQGVKTFRRSGATAADVVANFKRSIQKKLAR